MRQDYSQLARRVIPVVARARFRCPIETQSSPCGTATAPPPRPESVSSSETNVPVVAPSGRFDGQNGRSRSEEHTSELQSRENLVCRLLLEKKNHNQNGAETVVHRLD